MNRGKKEVDNTKYYTFMGLEKTANAEDIRKTYRKLAAKMHPDKGGDQAKFQELQQVYEVLSDPKKREIYDTYGEEGLKEGMGGGADFDPFQMFFNQRESQNVRRKCKARLIQLKITLEDVYVGARKEVEFSRRTICGSCKGNGSANPAANNKCSGCQGRGVKVIMQRMGHIVLQQQATCPDCRGEGQVIKDKCKGCKGEKVAYVNTKVAVDVDKGVPDGHRYNFPDQGDEYPEIETGDLQVEIFIENSKTFVRKGADLVYKTQISLLQALTGLSFVITHLDGRKIMIKTKEGEIIKPLTLKTVKDLGMPFHNAPYKYGHLYIDFEIVFPGELDEEEVKQITEILRNERLHKPVTKDMTDEVYLLSDYKIEDENTHHSGGNKRRSEYEEDEDAEDGGGYHKTYDCAHQ